MKGFALFLTIYIGGGLLTGAYYYQHRAWPCGERAERSCRNDHTMETAYATMLWPFYWGWRGAIEVTR